MSTEQHVIFGTGQVGSLLMNYLHRQGKQVRVISRSGLSDLPAGVEQVQGDVLDLAFAETAGRGANVIYMCLNLPYTEWGQTFPLLQSNVIRSAASSGAKLVVLENMYMYGSTNGQPIKESMPYEAKDRKGATRARMTEALFEAHQQGMIQATSARAADFFGPGVVYGPAAEMFVNALTGKPIQMPFSIDLPHSLTYLPTVAEGLAILGASDQADGRAWHIPNPPARSVRQILDDVTALTGQQIDVSAVPGEVLEQIAPATPMIAELLEIKRFYAEPYIVDVSDFVSTFGNIAPSWEQALPATIHWYQENSLFERH
jgi:nucleoside-diphosphate-sugar epimerase